ncbi:unnamed protein product [Allacma fusca]|uniref:NADP-dependent oxidoreductase domain-containing protein n=1 Tax=Allacma fusca TaxID=39272 RepID=A0A8J2KGS6_9HEXA|nr:unnamed protein product [Allacma fusca]
MTSIRFFNGHSMPLVGLGTWQSTNPEELEQALDAALEAGYRHIDTANFYRNEKIIGTVLKRWLDSGKIKRKELFIVTKLPPQGMRTEHVPHFLQLSLQNLQLDYIDLYLVHSPLGFHYFTDAQLDDPKLDPNSILDMKTDLESVWTTMEEQPANHQIELHAYFQRPELLKTCKKHNITIVAYAPIGSPGRKEFYETIGLNFKPITLLENPRVLEIALKHSKTPAQIVMKFLVQQDIAVIPKSTNLDRLRQNLDLFSFELTPEEMLQLTALDQGMRPDEHSTLPYFHQTLRTTLKVKKLTRTKLQDFEERNSNFGFTNNTPYRTSINSDTSYP